MRGETIIPLQALGFSLPHCAASNCWQELRPHSSTTNPALGDTPLLPSRLMKILALLILWNSVYCCYSQGDMDILSYHEQCELYLDFLSPPQEDWGPGFKTEFWCIFKVFFFFFFFCWQILVMTRLAMKYYSGDSLDHLRGNVKKSLKTAQNTDLKTGRSLKFIKKSQNWSQDAFQLT